MRIGFVIPNTGIGGGNSVVIAHARCAVKAGHDVAIVVSQGAVSSTGPRMDGLSVVPLSQASRVEFDVAIVSWWEDLSLLPKIAAHYHLLFLQRLEDRIYTVDAHSRMVKDAFRVPLPGITISKWLHDQFLAEYGRDYAVVYDGIDKSIFRQDGHVVVPRRTSGLRVLVEGPLGDWHKNVVPALRVARSIGDETWLLTSTNVGPISGVDRVFSRLPPDAAASVYRSCDVLLKLSLIEGLGLPALEMFHCGGTVIAFDVPPVTEYAEHGRNALLAPAGDFGTAAEHLMALRDQRNLLGDLRLGALETARRWPSEGDAGACFLAQLGSLVCDEPPTTARVLEQLASLAQPSKSTFRALARSRIRDVRIIRSVRHSIQVRAPGVSSRQARRPPEATSSPQSNGR